MSHPILHFQGHTDVLLQNSRYVNRKAEDWFFFNVSPSVTSQELFNNLSPLSLSMRNSKYMNVISSNSIPVHY